MNKSYYAVIPANVRYDKELSANAKLLYGEITALCNEKGYCWANNSYFSDLYQITKRSVARLISQLEQKGYIKTQLLNNNTERHIYLSSHDKNVIPPMTKLSPPHDKNVIPTHDKNVIHNNTLKNNTKNTTGNKDMVKTFDLEFETLWKKYPNKKKKKEAKNSFIRARKKGTSLKTIENGLNRYIAYIELNGIETRFIKHGSTWFNGECWNDEYDFTPPRTPNSNKDRGFLGDIIELERGALFDDYTGRNTKDLGNVSNFLP